MAFLVAMLLGTMLGGANYWALTGLGIEPLARPELGGILLGGPVLLALLCALILSSESATETEADVDAETAPSRPEASALRLLAILQEEGRLIDFLTEDIGPYSDQEVGAAVRDVQESSAKALRSLLTVEPIMAGEEEEEVTIEVGFDPAAVRLTGNVAGDPPFTGVLRHGGWRMTRIELPETATGGDLDILAPAEVEIP